MTRPGHHIALARLRVALGSHPRTPPIARASLETAAALADWTAERRAEAVAPQRQERPRTETERFRNGVKEVA